MNKEQLIRELKHTKEKHKNDKLYTFDTDISSMCDDILDVLSRCVEIPVNATNGDAIKMIFGDKLFGKLEGLMMVSCDWWNSPYQKGGKE